MNKMTDWSINYGEANPAAILAGSLAQADREYLSGLLEWRSAQADECLWREGDVDDRLVMVASGRVRLLKSAGASGFQVVIGLFGTGTLVPDLAFAQSGRRETSAWAAEDVQLIFLSGKNLETILAERPQLGSRILKQALLSVAGQLRHTYRRLNAFL